MGEESLVNPFFVSSMSRKSEVARRISDSANFLLRGATSTDLMQLAEILTMSFHSRKGFLRWIYPLFRLGIYEDLRNRLRSPLEQYVCLVAEVIPTLEEREIFGSELDEVLAGTVEMTVRSRHLWQFPALQYPYLSNLAVHPDYRRRGVAQQLLCNCEETALEWGFTEIYLHVLENNHGARRLYYQLGYRVDHIDSSWLSWLLGKPRRFLLRKHIGDALIVNF
jgi:ribosomal protein S18 acetylase RimI-like enzyme